MALFGLVSKKEYQALQLQIESLKAEVSKVPSFLLQTAEAERFNMPDPSVYGNQADLYRLSSWVLQAVSFVASAASLTPFEVSRIVAGKEPKDIPNHEFEMLLAHPNP